MTLDKETLTRVGRRAAKVIAHSSLPEIFLVASLCIARYLQNADFSYPSEVVLTIMLFAVVVTTIYYVFRLVLRRIFPAHVAALLLSYALYSYTYTFVGLHHLGDRLIPYGTTPFPHALYQTLILAIVFGAAAFVFDLMLRKVKQLSALPLLNILLFAVCFIFAAQLGKVGLRVWTIRHDLFYKAPAVSLQQPVKPAAGAAKPNVYYLLFDRYASATTLQKDYNYDNTPLLNNLSAEGFVNRTNAYANYPFTMQSVSSTLAMQYHTVLGKQFANDAAGYQTAFPYRKLLDNPPVAQAFTANGYSYNQVSSWWDFTRKIPSATTEPTNSFRLRMFGKNYWLTDLQRDIVNKSILSPLLLKGMTIGKVAVVKYQLDRNPSQNFQVQMAALKTIASNSATQKQPQFTFAHILSPHDPYVFDENGNAPSYGPDRDDNGADETVKYTNQLTYVNTQIESLIETIRTKDPGAAIVLQADEGPYPKQFRGTLVPGFFYDPINLPVQQMQQKFGVLASYYMPGTDDKTVTDNITTSANAFRFVLSNYLGYKLPLLPDCQFAVGDKYSLYNFQLVTGKLNGTTEPAACKQYQ